MTSPGKHTLTKDKKTKQTRVPEKNSNNTDEKYKYV